MSLIDVLYSKYPAFRDVRGRQLRFKSLNGSDLRCWHVKHWYPDSIVSTLETAYILVPAVRVSECILKYLGIWDKLTGEVQQSVINAPVEDMVLEDEPRSLSIGTVKKRGRRSKAEYADLPREISCSKCGGGTTYIPPSVLMIKAGLENLDGSARLEKLQEFLDGFKCATCSPRRRGKVRNPLYKDIPRLTHCKTCGKECVINAKNVYELTGGDKLEIVKYCKDYLCRSCNPEWGSWLRGKRGKKGKKRELVES